MSGTHNCTSRGAGDWTCLRGVCDAPTGTCVCEAGFSHDISLGFFENCSMPSWWIDVALALCIALSVMVAILSAMALRNLPSASYTSRALHYSLFTQFSSIIACIVFYVQGYPSGTFWLFQFFCVSGVFGSVILLMQNFFTIASRVFNTTLPERLLTFAFVWMVISGAAPFIQMTVVAYVYGNTDPDGYNRGLLAFFFLLPLHELTAVPIFASLPNHLIKVTNTVRNNVASMGGGQAEGGSGGGSAPSPGQTGTTATATTVSPNAAAGGANSNAAQIELFTRRLRLFSLVLITAIVPSITLTSAYCVTCLLVTGEIVLLWFIFAFVLMGYALVGTAILILVGRRVIFKSKKGGSHHGKGGSSSKKSKSGGTYEGNEYNKTTTENFSSSTAVVAAPTTPHGKTPGTVRSSSAVSGGEEGS